MNSLLSLDYYDQPVSIERSCLFSQPFPCVKLGSHWLQYRPCPLAKEKLLSFFRSQHIPQVNRFSNSAIYNYLKISHYYYSFPTHQNQLVAGVCPTCIYSHRKATGRMIFLSREKKAWVVPAFISLWFLTPLAKLMTSTHCSMHLCLRRSKNNKKPPPNYMSKWTTIKKNFYKYILKWWWWWCSVIWISKAMYFILIYWKKSSFHKAD